MKTLIEHRSCATCNEEFDDEFDVFYVNGQRGRALSHVDCPRCREAKLEAEIAREQQVRLERQGEVREDFPRRALMPRKLWKQTFQSWVGKRGEMGVAKSYADNFPQEWRPWGYHSLMLFSRLNGTGKTHLCAAIANQIFALWNDDPDPRPGCPVLYHTDPTLLVRIRATYNVRPGEESWRETEKEVYDSIAGKPLLILDDVGKDRPQRASEHTKRVYFHIVDERYNAELPMVLASNMTLAEMETFLGSVTGPAVVSRLTEMLQGKVVELSGPDYRKKLAAEAGK